MVRRLTAAVRRVDRFFFVTRYRETLMTVVLVFFATTVWSLVQLGNVDERRAHDSANARLTSCQQQAKQQRDLITVQVIEAESQAESDRALIRTLADQVAPEPRDPDTERRVQQSLAAMDATIDEGFRTKLERITTQLRVRDCTTRGIADYLSGRGGYLPSPTATTTEAP